MSTTFFQPQPGSRRLVTPLAKLPKISPGRMDQATHCQALALGLELNEACSVARLFLIV
jgi:hypothetical protein